MSHTLLFMRAIIPSSSACIPNRFKSGLKVTLVQFSSSFVELIFGLSQRVILSYHVIENFFPYSPEKWNSTLFYQKSPQLKYAFLLEEDLDLLIFFCWNETWSRFNGELQAIDVGQFSTQTVTSSSYFLFSIVKITSSEKMTKNQLWYIYSMLFMNFDRNSYKKKTNKKFRFYWYFKKKESIWR